MSDPDTNKSGSLTAEAIRQLEERCDRFESECDKRSSPMIEDYLVDATEPLTSELLKQLILIEWDHEHARGQLPPLGVYYSRFAELAHVLDEACRTWLAEDPTGFEPDHIASTRKLRNTGYIGASESQSDSQSPSNPSDRYIIQNQIGRGGTGIVYRGRDRLLGRRLALKTLREDCSNQRDLADRFNAEAQISSQLQHPGIAPVYDQSCLGDGRPVLAMKLVEGRTLAEVLADREDSNDDHGRLLSIFEQICQAIGYAHARDIVHRDLKPANVMIGEFGEVQVMDWGLAKVLSTNSNSENPKPATDRIDVDDHRHSQDGQIMGTLGYMSPEQARGELSAVDERSDVFSLGAILCEILTGKPPVFEGSVTGRLRRSNEDVVEEIRKRLASSYAEQPIIELVLRCLAFNPNERPRNGAMVADDVRAHVDSLQAQLVDQKLKREKAQILRVAESRRRKLRLSLVATLVILAVVSAIAGIYWQGQRAQRVRELELADNDLARAEQYLSSGDFRSASESLKEANARIDQRGPTEMSTRYDSLVEQVNFALRLKQIENRRITPTNLGWFDNARALAEYQDAFEEIGIDVFDTEMDPIVQRITDSLVRDSVLAAIDNWALVYVYRMRFDSDRRDEYKIRRDQLLDLARLIDPHPELRDKLRDPSYWDEPSQLVTLADSVQPTELSPRLAALLGELLRFSGGDPEAYLRRFQAAYPNDFWLNFDLARAVRQTRPEEALRFYQAALSVEPRNFSVLGSIGLIFTIQNDLRQAKSYFEQALEINPDYIPTRKNLATVLLELGHPEEAASEFRRVIASVPDDALAHVVLGDTLIELGDWNEARLTYETAVLLFPEFTPPGPIFSDGRIVTIQQAQGTVHCKIGQILADQAKLVDAERHLQQAVELYDTYAQAHLHLGLVQQRLGEFDESIVHLAKARELGANSPNWTWPTERWRAQSERLRDLDLVLSEYIDGTRQTTDTVELQDIARLCHDRSDHMMAVDFFATALEQSANEIDCLDQFRFLGACSALNAIDDSVRDESNTRTDAQLRQLALTWLEQEYELWAEVERAGEGGSPSPKRIMLKWLQTPQLARVRDESSLALLSQSERDSWTDFWTKVADSVGAH